eukprot:gene40795-55147_t
MKRNGYRAVDLALNEETRNVLRTWKPPSQEGAQQKAKTQTQQGEKQSPSKSVPPPVVKLSSPPAVSPIASSAEIQLLAAAEEGNETEIKNLLGDGVNIHCKDADRWTALHWATWNDHTAIVTLLLKQGADIGAKDN